MTAEAGRPGGEGTARSSPIPIRRHLFAWHRDVGFVCLGLALVYAVSGVAVNHRHHWNPSYVTRVESVAIGTIDELGARARSTSRGASPAPGGEGTAAVPSGSKRETLELAEQIRTALHVEAPVRNALWRGPEALAVYFGEADRDVVEYSAPTGVAARTTREPRPLFHFLNALHLNQHRRAWTWIGDLFALALAFLAVSGTMLARGRKGLRGRGGLLALAGIVLPLLLVLLFG